MAYTVPVKLGTSGADPQTIFLASPTGTHPLRAGTGSLPLVSPNGRWVAYIAGSVAQPDGTGLINTATRAFKHLSTSLIPVEWAPNSETLLVRDPLAVGGYELIGVPAGKVFSIRIPRPSALASFSPNGASIVFEHWTGGAFRPDIYTIPVSGGSPRRLTFDRRSGVPLWGAHGIAFERFGAGCVHCPGDVWIMSANGSGLRRLTRTNAYVYPAAWSADGARLLAASGPDPTGRLYAIDIPGGQVRALTPPVAGILPFGISRDGTQVIAGLNCSSLLPPAKRMIESVPAAGGAPTILVRGACDANWNA